MNDFDFEIPDLIGKVLPNTKELKILSVIGYGSFAVVYKAEDVHHHLYAVKCIIKKGLNSFQLELQYREAELLQRLENHPNIVNLYQVIETEEHLFLVLDYCECDLFEAIVHHHGFGDQYTKEVFKTIIDTVQYLHERKIYHRDLKPENILITKEGEIKIADFGLACSDDWSRDYDCGTVRYEPPECVDTTSKGYCPEKSDLWALGVILVNIRFERNPWAYASPEDNVFFEFSTNNPDVLQQQLGLSDQMNTILKNIFKMDSKQRWTLDQIKEAISNIDEMYDESKYNPLPPKDIHSNPIPIHPSSKKDSPYSNHHRSSSNSSTFNNSPEFIKHYEDNMGRNGYDDYEYNDDEVNPNEFTLQDQTYVNDSSYDHYYLLNRSSLSHFSFCSRNEEEDDDFGEEEGEGEEAEEDNNYDYDYDYDYDYEFDFDHELKYEHNRKYDYDDEEEEEEEEDLDIEDESEYLKEKRKERNPNIDIFCRDIENETFYMEDDDLCSMKNKKDHEIPESWEDYNYDELLNDISFSEGSIPSDVVVSQIKIKCTPSYQESGHRCSGYPEVFSNKIASFYKKQLIGSPIEEEDDDDDDDESKVEECKRIEEDRVVEKNVEEKVIEDKYQEIKEYKAIEDVIVANTTKKESDVRLEKTGKEKSKSDASKEYKVCLTKVVEQNKIENNKTVENVIVVNNNLITEKIQQDRRHEKTNEEKIENDSPKKQKGFLTKVVEQNKIKNLPKIEDRKVIEGTSNVNNHSDHYYNELLNISDKALIIAKTFHLWSYSSEVEKEDPFIVHGSYQWKVNSFFSRPSLLVNFEEMTLLNLTMMWLSSKPKNYSFILKYKQLNYSIQPILLKIFSSFIDIYYFSVFFKTKLKKIKTDNTYPLPLNSNNNDIVRSNTSKRSENDNNLLMTSDDDFNEENSSSSSSMSLKHLLIFNLVKLINNDLTKNYNYTRSIFEMIFLFLIKKLKLSFLILFIYSLQKKPFPLTLRINNIFISFLLSEKFIVFFSLFIFKIFISIIRSMFNLKKYFFIV